MNKRQVETESVIGKVLAVALLVLLTVEKPLAQENVLVQDESDETSFTQVTFFPVLETWATNVFDISIRACVVQLPHFIFSEGSAVYRLTPGKTSAHTLGQAVVLRHSGNLKEGTLLFVIGRGRDQKRVQCEGADVLYGDLPSSPVTFRLTRVDDDVSCSRVETETE